MKAGMSDPGISPEAVPKKIVAEKADVPTVSFEKAGNHTPLSI
jgi:hypothetical protein